MTIRQLIPWRVLTRTGAIPPFKVARRDLVLGEVTIPVGVTLDPELIPPHIRRERLRQFYEMRRLELVNPPKNAQQYYRDQLAQAVGHIEEPIAPVTPVASRIVADLPSVDVPVEPEERPRRKGAK